MVYHKELKLRDYHILKDNSKTQVFRLDYCEERVFLIFLVASKNTDLGDLLSLNNNKIYLIKIVKTHNFEIKKFVIRNEL